jgi:2,3-diketo-5-methylthio-1-phosphopentane phosphatase
VVGIPAVSTPRQAILQLDFDGTLVQGDVNEGLFRRFVSEEWTARIEAASHELSRDPSSPALIDALKEASAHLVATDEECLAFAAENNLLRDGLPELIETARRLGMECHVVSYGYEFYVRHFLRLAGVEDALTVHCGEVSLGPSGRLLSYTGPSGEDITSDWKVVWTRSFRSRADRLVYVGDGGSDVAPAQLCDAVFARDALLERMPASYTGTLQPFEALHDVTRGLETLLG